MDDGVGGPADREQHARRVLDRLLRHDAARTKARADQRNRDPPGLLGDAEPIGVDGGNRRGARGHHAERLGQRGHRARRPHHRAGARRGRQALLDLLDLGVADRARAMERPKAPAVRAGAEPLAVMAARRHRAADELDRRNIGGGRAHQLRRHGLVASADEHDGVHRLGAHHLLDVHRHQIAKFQAGRVEKDLSQRDGRKFDRQRAGRENAAFDRLDQLGKVAMAIVEAARRTGDADDRTIEHLPAVPHRTRERPPEVETEIAVAVIGEAPAEAAIVFLLLGHGHLPHANALGPRPCNASFRPRQFAAC